MTAAENSERLKVPEQAPTAVDPPEAAPAPTGIEPLVPAFQLACPAASHRLRLPLERRILAVRERAAGSITRNASSETTISRAHPLSPLRSREGLSLAARKWAHACELRVSARLRSPMPGPLANAGRGSPSRVPLVLPCGSHRGPCAKDTVSTAPPRTLPVSPAPCPAASHQLLWQ